MSKTLSKIVINKEDYNFGRGVLIKEDNKIVNNII